MIKYSHLFIVALLLALGFVADLQLPSGIATGTLYAFVICYMCWVGHERLILLTSSIAAGLILLGLVMSPREIESALQVFANRTLSIAVVAAVAVLGLLWNRSRFRLAEVNRNLQVQVDKQARHLASNTARTREILENAYDAFVAINSRGRIIGWNTRASQMFGWERDEVLGRTVAEVCIPPRFHDQHNQGMRNYLKTGEGRVLNRRLEMSALHRDGHEFPVEMTITAIVGVDDCLFSAFLHDISSRKEADQRLREARASAESASKAKSLFLANMSHEIRTPLNAIIGLTELLLETHVTREQQEHLRLLQESGECLLELINDILDFSKIEAGRLELHTAAFDLHDVLGDALKTFALRAHQKDLELISDIPPDVPRFVVGDRFRLRQVMLNLVGNAIKFTDFGEVVMRIECESSDVEHARLKFNVLDTGVGIPADRLAHVFEAFEQADGSITRRHGGTGLGLAIAARLVALMGGKIDATSEPGKGSCFHFCIEFPIPSVEPQIRSRSAETMLKNVRVLVVDDNETNLRILERMLANWGMHVSSLRRPEQVVKFLREEQRNHAPIEVVLLDRHMTPLDGIDLAGQIQAAKELDGTIVMMLSSADRPADLRRCEELGIHAYLTKPIKSNDLCETLLAAIDGVQERFEQAAATAPVLPSLRVLLAEDSLVNQQVASQLLEHAGMKVKVVNNGKEALAAVDTDEFDIVLMDVQMPELDGLEATQMIRDREFRRGGHVPIVAMTAFALEGDSQRCLDAGMDGYVAKPIRRDELLAEMARVLQTSAGNQAAAQESDDAAEGLLDLAGLRRTGTGWRSMVKPVGDAFLEQLDSLLEQIESSLAQRDAQRLFVAAHTLKGSARYFCSQPVYRALLELEQLADQQRLDEARDRFGPIRGQVLAVAAAVENMLQQTSATD